MIITIIYTIIKEIYEKRVELTIMLITTAIALGIGIYVISTTDISHYQAFQNLSHIKSEL
jgi:hypothetical protein